MSEPLRIVMAADALEASRRADEDTIEFEPGPFALRVLGAAILGNPSPNNDEDSGLLPVSGPPDPIHDEGVFVHQLADEVVRTLASWGPDGRRQAAEEWSTELSRFHAPRGGLAKLAPPLYALADLAKRAVAAEQKLFARHLVR